MLIVIEIKGNFEDIYREYEVVCCTTNTTLNKNDELIMGKGIAKIFAEKFRFLPEVWGQMILDAKERNLPQIFVKHNYDGYPEWLVSFPTKTDWRKNSTLEIIENSAKQLDFLADSLGWTKILLPRPGCCNGGLKWEDVKPKIDFLDDRFYILSK